MGRTQHWDTVPANLLLDYRAQKVIKKIVAIGFKKGVIQYESDDNQPPLVNTENIVFNGVGENGHETFHIWAGQDTWLFCKTAYKPYDRYVMAVLYCLRYFARENGIDWRISSENTSEENKSARSLFNYAKRNTTW